MAAINERLSFLHSSEAGHQHTSVDINPCKNLNEIFSSLETVECEHLKVFLRVRPQLRSEEGESEEKNVSINDETSVVLTAPAGSHAFKSKPHGISKVTQKFTFSHIYGPDTSQKTLYDKTTHGLVSDLLQGQNCLLFTYGATNSGKTYTIQGIPSDFGVLPRALEDLFSSIGPQHYKGMDLKPQHFSGVIRLSEKEICRDEEIKENIIKQIKDPSLAHSKSSISLCSTISRETENQSNCTANTTKSDDSSPVEFDSVGNFSQALYAVFVSYAEIYKEYIYDLLENPQMCKKGKRPPLILGEDKDGAIYVKGLREVRVTSLEEALQIVESGCQHLHFASTLLNHHSSRSHCIFTIKLIQIAHSDYPHVARVSMLSICDLAGTERQGKAFNSQDRLKEANNINNSLLVLGRCISALRQNQVMQKQNCGPKKQIPVPYRDSKVTRLFQSFFMGRGRMAMIVNICTSFKLFDETLKVLKFSALASKVVIVQERNSQDCSNLEDARRNSHFARLMRQSYAMSRSSSGRLSVPWESNSTIGDITFGGIDGSDINKMVPVLEEEEEEEDDDDDSRTEVLLDLIRKLKDKLLQESKDKQNLEAKLRKDLCEDFGRKIVEIEDSWRSRIKDERARAQDYMDWRVHHIMDSVTKGTSRKRQRPDEVDPDEEMVSSACLFREEMKNEALEEEKQLLEEELEAIRNSLKASNQTVKSSQGEVSRLTFQLAQLTASYDRLHYEKTALEISKQSYVNSTSENVKNLIIEELQEKNSSVQKLLEEKNKEVAEIKNMLDEAAEEFVSKELSINHLKSQVSSMKENYTKQSLTVAELENLLTEAKEMLANQGCLLDEREQTVYDLREEMQHLKYEQLTTDQTKLESLQRELDSVAKRKENLAAELEQKNDQIETILKDAQSEKALKKTEFSELQKTLEAESLLKRDLLTQIQTLTEELNQSEVNLLEKEKTLQSTTTDLKLLNDDLLTNDKTNVDRIGSLKKDVETLEDEIRGLKKENETLCERVVASSSRCDELVEEKTSFSSKLESFQLKLTDRMDENKKLLERVQQLTLEVEEMRGVKLAQSEELESLNSRLLNLGHANEKNILNLKDSFIAVEEENKRLKRQCETSREEKNSFEQEFELTKGNLKEYREMLVKATGEEEILHGQNKNLSQQLRELKASFADKEALVFNLSSKMDSLDRKTSRAEDECAAARTECECLQKEVAAVRSARTEEVSRLEANVESKEEEITSLQRELKLMLQQSVVSTSSSCVSGGVKREYDDGGKIGDLEEQLGLNKVEISNLLMKITSMEKQLHDYESRDTFAPPKCGRITSKRHQTLESSEVSEAETPARRTRNRTKKSTKDSVCQDTPGGESLRLVLDASEDEGSLIASTRSRRTRQTIDDSLANCFKTPRSVKNLNVDDESADNENDDDCAPSGSRNLRQTRKNRSRRNTNVQNPHFEKENIDVRKIAASPKPSAGKAAATEDPKPRRTRRRPLYTADAVDRFECSPNILDALEQADSPHTIVRRQLRRKK